MATERPISDADRELAFGNQTPVPVARREADPMLDSPASDGVQPGERRNVHRQATPGGGR